MFAECAGGRHDHTRTSTVVAAGTMDGAIRERRGIQVMGALIGNSTTISAIRTGFRRPPSYPRVRSHWVAVRASPAPASLLSAFARLPAWRWPGWPAQEE